MLDTSEGKDLKDITFVVDELEKAIEKYKSSDNKNEIIKELIEAE